MPFSVSSAITRADIPTFVSHLECSLTEERYSPDSIHNLSHHGKPLRVRYDLNALGRALKKSDLLTREPDMSRYREFLPVRRAHDIVSLGEVITPLIGLPRTQARIGAKELVMTVRAL